jgi:uncharacterized protein (TIGR03083 family)
VDRERLLQIIAEESADLLKVAAADLGARLVFYPQWTMLDLLVHTGSVQQRTTRIVAERSTERLDRVYPPSEDPGVVPGWFEDGYRGMVGALGTADPDMAVWGFGRHPTVAFWTTRMALEAAVHRWDAQRAVTEPRPLDAGLAVLGIDEFGWMNRPDRPADCPYSGDLLALRAADTGDAWIVSVADDRFRMRRGDDGALTVVAAEAADLYLWLMGRDGAGVRVDGDGDAASWWERLVRSAPHAVR